MIGGSLYRPKTTDSKGQPLVYKNGAKKGQPRQDFSFGVAYPKTPGVQHWASEPWLQQVWALAHAAFPQGQANRPDFSFKITDGDSQLPNKNMKRPCDQEGYPGHWVIWFSSTTAPKAVNANGTEVLTQPDAIKPGYYVQVMCTVTDNKPSETPGLYWNPHYVALSGYGPEIVGGPDLSAAGFGQGVQLPAGASATPLGGMTTPPAPGAAVPPPPGGAPAAPAPVVTPPAPPAPPVAPAAAAGGLVQVLGAQYTIEQCRQAQWTDEQIVAAGVATRAAAPAPAAVPPAPPAPLAGSVPAPAPAAGTAPVPVTPNPAFTQMVPPPAAGAAVPPPPGAVAAPVRQPTALAGGRTLDQLLAMPGWNMDLLVQHGYVA
jgi:hypothetical protein